VLILILLLVTGSILAYLSHNNLMLVSVNLGPYVFSDVPLFYVIIGSLLAGLILSYLISLIHSISTSFTLRGKEKEIQKNKNEVLELTKRVHQLELENEKLKNKSSIKPKDANAL
jgi:putative membrane protein